ncbi:tyrosine-type recombinase/integrase [Microbacterium sp. NPDC055357]
MMTLANFSQTTNADRHAALTGAWLMSLGSEHTRRAYRGDIRGMFAFLDSFDLDALEAERRHLDAYRLTLTGAASTVARKLAAASSFYSYASIEGAMPHAEAHPVRRVVRPRVDADHSATRGLSKSEALAFLDAAEADGPRAFALVSLLVMSGARLSEVLGADRAHLQHDNGHRVLVVTRKGGKVAKLALPAQTVAALSVYLGASAAAGQEIVTADAASADAPLFTTATGKRWAASEAFRTVQRIARRAGIDGAVSPHSLRHTHATLALDAGVTLADLQDSMGHADPRTTRRYDRARGRLERSSAYAVASALG